MVTAILMAMFLNGKEPKWPEPAPDPEYIRCTCYTWTGNKTASGIYPHEGIIAGRPEDIGKVAVIYDSEMRLIGYFEIQDTGGRSIRNGHSIDVYRDTLEGCHEWVEEYGDYVYMQIIEAKG